MKNERRHLKFLVPDRQHDGTKCPACPQVQCQVYVYLKLVTHNYAQLFTTGWKGVLLN